MVVVVVGDDWSTVVLPIHAAASRGTQAITMISAEPRSLPIASMTPFTSGRPPRTAERSPVLRGAQAGADLEQCAEDPGARDHPTDDQQPDRHDAPDGHRRLGAGAGRTNGDAPEHFMASGVSPPASNSTENTNASTAKPAE